MSVMATASSGFTFQSLSCSGTVCFAGSSNPTAAITVNNPLTETANFQTTPTLALDGSGHSECGACTSKTATITTGSANDVIGTTFVFYIGGGASFSGISGTPTVTYSTSNADDLVFVLGSNDYTGRPFAAEWGYTLIQAGGADGGSDSRAEYQVVSSAQSSVTSNFRSGMASGAYWIDIADAIQGATTGGAHSAVPMAGHGLSVAAPAQLPASAPGTHSIARDGTQAIGLGWVSSQRVSTAHSAMMIPKVSCDRPFGGA